LSSVFDRSARQAHAASSVVSIALRNLIRQTRRTGVAVTAIACGIVAMMLAGGFIEWIFLDMRESTIHAHFGHLQIVRPGYYELGRADPFRYLLPERGPWLDAVLSSNGVVNLAPRLYFSGLVSHGDTTLSFIGEAVDATHEKELSNSLIITQGAALVEGDARGVLFGEGLARNLGANVGDQVVLVATKASGGVNAVELTVRGLMSSITKSYDDSALRVSIGTARELLHARGAHAWVILLGDTAQTDAVATQLRGELPRSEFEVVPWYALADFYNKTVSLFSKQMTVIKVIIGVIIVLSITNTMMMTVLERTGEVGTSLALGLTRRRILASFLCEGTLLGIVGAILGLGLSVALAYVISAIGIPMPPPPGMAHGYMGAIVITPRLAVQAVALAVGTAVAASAYPAWRASRLVIVDALRHNR
jgi:putative ABC transport system permease protein